MMNIVMKIFIKDQSSVRFLVSGSGTWTTVLLWFASSWVSDQQSSVVLKKELLDLSFLCLVDEFLVVGNDTLGNGLSDGVNLSNITTSSDGDSDVKILESFKSEKEDWLHDFNSEWGWLEQLNGWSVDSEDAFTVSDSGVGNGVFLSSEALNELIFSLWHGYGE